MIQRVIAFYKTKDFGQWFGKGFWAVTDQGLFAVSNFALSTLLARWLVPQDYGAFIMIYTVFWLLGTFHTALLTEPMLVYGPGKYRGRLSKYLGFLLYSHVGFSVLSSLLLLLTYVVFRLTDLNVLSSSLLGLVLAGPFILFQWLMRRACYINLNPRLAASSGALYMILMLTGAYWLYQREWLSAAAAFGLMGLASLAACFWLIARLRVRLPILADTELVGEALKVHWSYGRWAAVTGVLMWFPTNIYYVLLPIWGGLEATAALRALMNCIIPIWHIQASLAILLVPALVQARGRAKFHRVVRLALASFGLGAALYALLLILLGDPLVAWLYKGQYSEYTNLLWLLALLPFFSGIVSVLGSELRALERPDQVFWAFAFSSVMTLTVGLGATIIWGVTGAAVGLLLSPMTTAGVMIWFVIIGKSKLRRGEYD